MKNEGWFHLQSRHNAALLVARWCDALLGSVEAGVHAAIGVASSSEVQVFAVPSCGVSRVRTRMLLGLATPRLDGPWGVVSPRDPDRARRNSAVRLAPRTIELALPSRDCEERWVRSEPVRTDGRTSTCTPLLVLLFAHLVARSGRCPWPPTPTHSSLPPGQGGAPTVLSRQSLVVRLKTAASAGGESGAPRPTRSAAGPGSSLGTLVGRLECAPVVPQTQSASRSE